MSISILLPWPHSLNRYYRTVSGRILISKEGREYRNIVRSELAVYLLQPGKSFLHGERLSVEIKAIYPDQRRRDLDNLLKGVLDALTHAGLWKDDSQIVDLRIRKAPDVVKGGLIALEVRAVE